MKKHTIETLLHSLKEAQQPEYVFFWGHTPRKQGIVDQSCLSQWWPSRFTVDHVVYQSAEQYMMAEKARLFADQEIWKNILSTHDPALAKKLGRQVRGFDSNIWKGKREEIVYQGNLAKFSQNMPIQKYLLSTGTNILVEASPEDTIWGIGLSADSPDAKQPEHWKGLNLLGFILMNVRSVLTRTSF